MKVTKAQSKPLNVDNSKLFILAISIEHDLMSGKIKESESLESLKTAIESEFFTQVIKKRIEVMKLPISFNLPALMAVHALCDRVGAAVILLIDCLEEYEGQEITSAKLADIYPFGFYNEDEMIKRGENIKNEQSGKWDFVYGI